MRGRLRRATAWRLSPDRRARSTHSRVAPAPPARLPSARAAGASADAPYGFSQRVASGATGGRVYRRVDPLQPLMTTDPLVGRAANRWRYQDQWMILRSREGVRGWRHRRRTRYGP